MVVLESSPHRSFRGSLGVDRRCGANETPAKRSEPSGPPDIRDGPTMFGNEENAENGMFDQQQLQHERSHQQPSHLSMNKRFKMGRTPTKFRRTSAGQREAPSCPAPSVLPPTSPVPSVRRDRGLRTPQSARAHGGTSSLSSSKEPLSATATTLVQRMVDRSGVTESATKKYFTPLRVKPKIKKEEVEATDSGYASVAKLSAWLADDPTSTKKPRHVRRGRNVIAKSRQFEKDLEDVVVEEANISRGAVTKQKDWLKNAFKEGDDDANPFGPRTAQLVGRRYAQSEIGAPTFASLSRTQSHDDGSRSEIIVDDAASSLSVSDKKDWLKNAFAKKTAVAAVAARGSPALAPKAQSDVLDLRGANREEATARAKFRFRERSARKLLDRNAAGTSDRPNIAAARTVHTGSAPRTDLKLVTSPAPRSRQHEAEVRTGPPTAPSPSTAPAPRPSARRDYVVDEDVSSVDFRAARALLVNRSKKNGNDVHIINKITSRCQQFEACSTGNANAGPEADAGSTA